MICWYGLGDSMRVIGVIGYKNSGKTRLIEEILKYKYRNLLNSKYEDDRDIENGMSRFENECWKYLK